MFTELQYTCKISFLPAVEEIGDWGAPVTVADKCLDSFVVLVVSIAHVVGAYTVDAGVDFERFDVFILRTMPSGDNTRDGFWLEEVDFYVWVIQLVIWAVVIKA